MTESPATRRRGKALETAIMQAVWEQLAEVGYAAMTVKDVAARARTSKAVLYRRWPSRAELVFAAIVHGVPTPDDLPDTGTLRSDTAQLLQQIAGRFATVDTDVLWGLLAESARDPELLGLIRSELLSDVHRGPTAVLVDRAVARGEVDPSRLTERRIALPLDLLRNEILVRGSITPEAIAEIVDEVFLPLVRPNPSG
ncbi:TetR/AcrR family transcriptional regulator [Streptomyces aculeolatus]|uniref:TetR/AcrR family transcriptional regulator n=1 Tax=Streptomyces aculeolatus TaxID=270689 RepID=UPI001CEDD0BD|nr:TetR/AcrR family transcriptional regulator [Streptomyces aculeolatus]